MTDGNALYQRFATCFHIWTVPLPWVFAAMVEARSSAEFLCRRSISWVKYRHLYHSGGTKMRERFLNRENIQEFEKYLQKEKL